MWKLAFYIYFQKQFSVTYDTFLKTGKHVF